ncbi:hypothetical protein ED176_00025 [Enterococcus faecium]|uniref:hypothetical protein n=1 Tax=Enterococcus TaxID=1350 RepID=UPI00115ED67D|nr:MULTISPECIES: hypothetical protein [Enterococcus]EGP5276281.1 hypothetical protein [Enterococcus faecium]EGP5436145.1 hypothetical protein [Enterococcus faecium]EGP5446627.1 hypothetical protein [Enterococcus faecium]EMF0339563.1 hypothetical protein [Enterococcus faecium]MBE6167367.1 hypothetical protein [Enterococcus faecium]
MDKIFSLLGGASFIVVIVKSVFDYISNRNLKKREAEQNKELEEIKSKLGSQVFVSNMQYQKEFDIYLELFEKLSKTTVYASQLLPIVEEGDAVSGDKDKILEEYKIRYKRFSTAQNNLADTRLRYAPFYMEEVNNLIKDLLLLTRKQGKYLEQFKLSGPYSVTPQEHKEAFTDFPKLIEDKYRDIEVLVRNYLNNLKITN